MPTQPIYKLIDTIPPLFSKKPCLSPAPALSQSSTDDAKGVNSMEGCIRCSRIYAQQQFMEHLPTWMLCWPLILALLPLPRQGSGDTTPSPQLVAQLVAAASSWGFFLVTNHGVPQELLDSHERAMHRQGGWPAALRFACCPAAQQGTGSSSRVQPSANVLPPPLLVSPSCPDLPATGQIYPEQVSLPGCLPPILPY